jgi:hypothetical protein
MARLPRAEKSCNSFSELKLVAEGFCQCGGTQQLVACPQHKQAGVQAMAFFLRWVLLGSVNLTLIRSFL